MFDCPICLAPITEDGPIPAVPPSSPETPRGRGKKRARENGIFGSGITGQCTTTCGHIFHIECLRQCFEAQGGPNYSCPTCKKRISPKSVVRVYMTCDNGETTAASSESKRIAKANRKSKNHAAGPEPTAALTGENVTEMIKSLHEEIASLKDFLLVQQGSENASEAPPGKRQKSAKPTSVASPVAEVPAAPRRPLIASRRPKPANSANSRVSGALRLDKVPRDTFREFKVNDGFPFLQSTDRLDMKFGVCNVL